MRHRDVRTSAARPLRGRRRPRAASRTSGRLRAATPATMTAGASASATGCSNAGAIVRTTASDPHSWAPCGACGCAPPDVTAEAATVGGIRLWCCSALPPCPTAHRMIASSRTAWIRVPMRRGPDKPLGALRAGTTVGEWGGTGPPCVRRPHVRGREAAGMGGGGRTASTNLTGRRVASGTPREHGLGLVGRDTGRVTPPSRPAWAGAVAKRPSGRTLRFLDLLYHGSSHGLRRRPVEFGTGRTRLHSGTDGSDRFANRHGKAGGRHCCPLLRLSGSAMLGRVRRTMTVIVAVRRHDS